MSLFIEKRNLFFLEGMYAIQHCSQVAAQHLQWCAQLMGYISHQVAAVDGNIGI